MKKIELDHEIFQLIAEKIVLSDYTGDSYITDGKEILPITEEDKPQSWPVVHHQGRVWMDVRAFVPSYFGVIAPTGNDWPRLAKEEWSVWLEEYAAACSVPTQKVTVSEYTNVVELARRNHRAAVDRCEEEDFQASVEAVMLKLRDVVVIKD